MKDVNCCWKVVQSTKWVFCIFRRFGKSLSNDFTLSSIIFIVWLVVVACLCACFCYLCYFKWIQRFYFTALSVCEVLHSSPSTFLFPSLFALSCSLPLSFASAHSLDLINFTLFLPFQILSFHLALSFSRLVVVKSTELGNTALQLLWSSVPMKIHPCHKPPFLRAKITTISVIFQ